jgi:uncharacterized protein YbaP (TraB family)
MKKKLTLLLSLMIGLFSSAQEAQIGLLWKISGNDLTKPSYIYGNMHVSSKIAFRLGEEFYDAISSVDKIALESNPIIWLDEIMSSELAENYIGDFRIGYQRSKGFYKKEFRLVIPDNNELSNALSRDHYFMNWLLYRENKSNSDFEEETFLDMFIYQAGAKTNREVVSLENFKENTKIVEKASIPDIEDKDPDQWFLELTKEKSYGDIMEEAYRKQDLSLIDSLQHQVSSRNSMYWMIEKRNQNMVEVIDSILKTGTTLFSGVGAAHLPGDKGMLKLLEELGYTVEAMPVSFTDKARAQREAYDDRKLPLKNFKPFATDIFSVNVPVSMYETPYSESQRHFFGPELTNGSHFTIKQISTLGYFKGISPQDFKVKMDSLLFENIPGKIESNKKFFGDFYQGFDITNKTKAGDYQRYKIYITPIHIIIFKMGGKDDYVKKYGNPFFESITIKTPGKDWKTTHTIHNDIQVSLPDYYSTTYNTKISSLYGHPIIEAWNKEDSSYYNIQRRSLYYFTHLEEDNFEMKRIVQEFFLKMGLDTVEAKVLNNQKYPTAIAKGLTRDSLEITVKVHIHGPYYYLLTSINSSDENKNRFFDSFAILQPKYQFENIAKTDSTTLLRVRSNYLSPTPIEYTKNQARLLKRNKNKTEDKSYLTKNYSEIFYSENFERVKVKVKKYHIYKSYANVDSLWSIERSKLLKNGVGSSQNYYSSYSINFEGASSMSRNDFILKSEKKSKENGLHVYYITLSDTNTSRAYFIKYILKHGMLYQFTAMGDTSEKMSSFVQGFFDNAQPLDTVAGRSLFEDKASLFFQSLLGEDSLQRVFAFKSVNMINFKKKDIDTLKQILDNYKFPVKYIKAKKELISCLIDIDEFNDMDYIRKLYYSAGDTSMYQQEILNSLAQKGSKIAIENYLDLLDYDIPISGSKYASSFIFSPLKYNLKNMKDKEDAFPDLLNYTFIDKYRESIMGALARQVDSTFIPPKAYKKNVKQILREAKIVLKEQISYEQSEQAKGTNRYSYSSGSYKYKENSLLVYYATVLIPYQKNKDVAAFLKKFESLKNYKVRNEVFCRMQKQGYPVDTAIWSELASDPVNVALLYETMEDWNLLELYPQRYIQQKSFAKALLFSYGFDFEEDSLMFVCKRIINDGKDSGYVYFFKTKEKGDDDWELNYIGLQPLDTTKVSLSKDIRKKGQNLNKSYPIEDIIDEKVNILNLRRRPHADGSKKRSRYGYYF